MMPTKNLKNFKGSQLVILRDLYFLKISQTNLSLNIEVLSTLISYDDNEEKLYIFCVRKK